MNCGVVYFRITIKDQDFWKSLDGSHEKCAKPDKYHVDNLASAEQQEVKLLCTVRLHVSRATTLRWFLDANRLKTAVNKRLTCCRRDAVTRPAGQDSLIIIRPSQCVPFWNVKRLSLQLVSPKPNISSLWTFHYILQSHLKCIKCRTRWSKESPQLKLGKSA